MKLSDILLLIKGGKRAAVGEIRNWKGGSYIKTATGWKPHEKQYSKKFVERKNNAAGKKESDLKHRQSEVARLSGEIQGHKAAVEHHTAQNTKQDIRQAKHHAIRAQVKQRRLDKHKEILEQRHGVKDEVQKPVIPKKVQDAKDLSGDLKEMTSRMEKQQATETENFKPFTETKDRVLGHALYKEYQNIYKDSPLLLDKKNQSDFIELNKNSFSENTDTGKLQLDKKIILPKKQTPVKSPEAKANFEKWKAERQEEKPKQTNKGIPQSISDFKINAKDLSIKNNNIEKPTPNPYKVGDLMYDGMDETDDTGYVYEMKMVDPNTIDYTEKYQSEDTVINDPTTQKYIEWFKQGIQPMPIQVIKHQDSGKLLSINRRRLLAAKQAGVKIPAFVEIGKYKDLKSKPTTPQEQPKPKENVIQAGSRGATIAGQQYSKREVDILNSLDDIIGRAKSPVVQDLLKKRQAAKVELPSKELGQPKLAAHENKFMELVKPTSKLAIQKKDVK